MITMLPDTWTSRRFEECLDSLPIQKPKKVLARDYAKAGAIPVVDQGQEFLAGWTNDEGAAIRHGLPYVIFGDHTRVFKFVDFPFALGADGTQLLKPKADFIPLFFYYACRHLPVPSRGYNRHFTLVKELSVPCPPLVEQTRIAAVLTLVQRAIETEEKLLATTAELKRAACAHLFARGTKREPPHDTDLGLLPASWEVVPLGALGRIGNGSTPLKSNAAFWTNGTIPWLTSAKVYDVTITHADQFVTQESIEACHLPRVKPGSVLIAITGQGKTLGHAAVTTIETCVSQHIAYLQFADERANSHFIRLVLEDRYDELRAVAQGGGSTKGALTCGFLKTFAVPLPPREEQDEIVAILTAIEARVANAQRRRACLVDLFGALINKLMTGEIRVDHLAVDTSPIAA